MRSGNSALVPVLGIGLVDAMLDRINISGYRESAVARWKKAGNTGSGISRRMTAHSRLRWQMIWRLPRRL